MKVSKVQFITIKHQHMPQTYRLLTARERGTTSMIVNALVRMDSRIEHMVSDAGVHLEDFFFGARLRTLCIVLGTVLSMYLSI